MHLFHVNHAAVLVSALIQWVLGAFWYGVAFKKSWLKLTGLASEGSPKAAVLPMISSFVASLVLSFVLAHVLLWAGTNTFKAGMAMGIVCWLGFLAPPILAQHIYERRPANLFAINGAYWLVAMALSGGVLAAWR